MIAVRRALRVWIGRDVGLNGGCVWSSDMSRDRAQTHRARVERECRGSEREVREAFQRFDPQRLEQWQSGGDHGQIGFDNCPTGVFDVVHFELQPVSHVINMR